MPDTTTSRWITLEGAHNVRDLGGLTTASDAITRSGVLLRSDALDRLTDGDVATLVEMIGLRHVVDLRSSSERAERGRGPLGALGSVTYTEVEVIPVHDLDRRRAVRESAFARGEDPDRVMADGYVELLELGAPAFRSAVEAIAADDGAPALFHCAAGKDRTGVLAALLLDLAGVAHGAIVADYALTDERMVSIVERLTGATSFEALAERIPVFGFQAKAATMAHFLVTLAERWGGASAYFADIGVEPGTVTALRGLLVDDCPPPSAAEQRADDPTEDVGALGVGGQ